MAFEGQEAIFKEIIQIVEQKENEIKKLRELRRKNNIVEDLERREKSKKKKKKFKYSIVKLQNAIDKRDLTGSQRENTEVQQRNKDQIYF